MAIHPDVASLLRESLPEYLAIARHAIKTPKGDGRGYYGYPAAALLFAVVDSIGSWHEGEETFTVLVDGVRRHISSAGARHFFVLNSEYFGLSLSGSQIDAVYACYRNPLAHNAALTPGAHLARGAEDGPIFHIEPDGSVQIVFVDALLVACECAVERFLASVDKVVPGARQESHLLRKRP